MEPIPRIALTPLIERYRVLLFDAYGVLVHSSGALPGAAELIRRLNRMDKPYFVITNDASKLPATAAARYRKYGLPLTPHRIISSGFLLAGYFAANRLVGARCAVLGPQDSVRYVEGAGGRIVAPSQDFDVLVVADEAGFAFLEAVDAALTSLCRALDRGRQVHLVLPNPDLIYPKGDQGFGFAAGSIAGMFESALRLRYPARTDLRFERLGKPHGAIFREALSRSGTRNMVMVGDQLETDIRGAIAFGIDAVWIASGVTGDPPASLPEGLRPTFWMHSLAGC